MPMNWRWFALSVAIAACALVDDKYAIASLKPRGVSQKKLSLYRPDQPFTCFDKSKTYTFQHVNDDYCDCPDGSDEPGTSACPNGRFYCANAGFRPKYISSMFVDDGVCDCCDGSDEANTPAGDKRCPNRCEELGKIAREAAEAKRRTMETGHNLYKEYVAAYQQEIGAKRERLRQVEQERTAAEAEKQRLQEAKDEVEKVEVEAKDKHTQEWEETKKALEEARQRRMAEEAFGELDTDGDGQVALAEIQAHLEFDVDGDGQVSADEAGEHLEDAVAADLAHFIEKVWPHIKEIYRRPGETTTAEPTPTSTATEVPPYGDEEEEDEEAAMDERMAELTNKAPYSQMEQEHEEHRRRDDEAEQLKMPEYPEETKKLIEAADQARNAFEDARKAFDDIDQEYSELVSVTATDFGPEGEFYKLRGECFEMEDREYVYKLCPFDRAGQKQKHGHHETSLGRFEAWRADAADNKYAMQIYNHGESCWNGPARSVTVRVLCGGENQVLQVSEPNRCEYAMDFATPSACRVPPPPIEHPSFWTDHLEHDDL